MLIVGNHYLLADKEVSTLRSMGYKIAKRFSKEEKSYIISQGYEVS